MARKYRHFVYDANQRFIYPTSDWGFKFLLGSEPNKDILLGILKEMLPDMGIESLEYLPRDIKIPVGKMKDASFDVFCKMHDGSYAVVEMQNYVRPTFLSRSLVYTSAAILSNYVNSNSKGYNIGKTIFIAFLCESLFKKVPRTPVRVGLCDVDEQVTTIRSDKLLQIYVELPKFAGSLEQMGEKTPFLEKLAYVMMEMADCNEVPSNLSDPLLERLFQAADTSTFTSEMKDNYMKSILGEADYENQLYDERMAAREEGLAEGIELGRQRSRAAFTELLKSKGLDPDLIREIESVF